MTADARKRSTDGTNVFEAVASASAWSFTATTVDPRLSLKGPVRDGQQHQSPTRARHHPGP